ncbi:IS110 family transposase [Roseateles sp.]|uniref:IS110 family transposase n=2 Tax=Roseateles TaxID=93681 RepID=UPI003BA4AE76
MQASVEVVGVDVAKAELVAARYPAERISEVIPNATAAIQKWLQTLPEGCIIAMEATGRFHQLLAQLAHVEGFVVYVLNARDVYFYARAVSARGKTDRLDAGVIARYVAEHRDRLRPWQPAQGVPSQLQELLGRRVMLTHQLVTLRLSLNEVATLGETAHRLEQAYQTAFEEIDRQLEQLVDSEPALKQGVQRLRTITGFGAQAAIRLAALFSRIKFDNANAVVAYSGLDPRPSDSGTHKGTRHLSKRGPALLRRQLYLAAFAACRSKALGHIYTSLRAKGFATTQALTILARKLLRVAWAIWQSGKTFDPSMVGTISACQKP